MEVKTSRELRRPSESYTIGSIGQPGGQAVTKGSNMAYESTSSPKSQDRVVVKWAREEGDNAVEGFVQVWAGAEGQDPFGEEDGWWVELDRAGINKLVKDLRRARNVAFGSDE